jgi:hypothetical protein
MPQKQQSMSNDRVQAYATMAKNRTVAVRKGKKISFEPAGEAVKKARKMATKSIGKRAMAK